MSKFSVVILSQLKTSERKIEAQGKYKRATKNVKVTKLKKRWKFIYMKSLKALVAGTTLAVGLAAFAGNSTDASAQTAYTVQSGDTLAKISQKYVGDFSLVNSIAQANGIANPNVIYAGTKLVIPSKGQAVTSTAKATTYSAPKTQTTQYKKPTYNTQKSYSQQAKTQSYKRTVTTTSTAGSNSAKEWIANKESGGSYSARSATGKYIGRYQLDKSYLNGDYSAANQERVANNYVKQRYGSWAAAKAFWVKNGWY
jgi:LysM repeat protein